MNANLEKLTVVMSSVRAEVRKDTASGLANLLRRNIADSELIKTCFEEWEKTYPRISPERLARVLSDPTL